MALPSNRKPVLKVANGERQRSDGSVHKIDQIKSFWRKHALPGETLRAFARRVSRTPGHEANTSATNWLHNKRANSSNPPKGIGRTNGKKKSKSDGGKKKG